jgi:hypothetical protein
MSKAKSLDTLLTVLGQDGIEALQKAIFHNGTQAVSDPSELYLPLLVVPRTILSWLVQNIKPMKPGEYKDLPFPGKSDVIIHVQKQDLDQYKGEFIHKGKVIHTFDKQGLPSIGGHLMSIGEDYDHLSDDHPAEPLHVGKLTIVPEPEEVDNGKPKDMGPPMSEDVVRSIMEMNDISVHSSDPEHMKWALAHANVRELTGVIGKLVDALVSKKIRKDKFEDGLDKVAEQECKLGNEANGPKRENSITPEEKDRADRKAADRPINDNAELKDQTIAHLETMRDTMKDKVDSKKPESKVVPAGEERQPPAKKEHALVHKEEVSAIKQTGKRMPEGEVRQPPAKKEHALVHKDEMPARKRSAREILMKPYRSDAQRRWAHTATGTEALGGKAAVHHWDEATKGRHLPEKVSKTDGSSPKEGHLVPSGPGSIARVSQKQDSKSFFMPVLKEEVNKFEPGSPPPASGGSSSSEPGPGSPNSQAAPARSGTPSSPPPKPNQPGAKLQPKHWHFDQLAATKRGKHPHFDQPDRNPNHKMRSLLTKRTLKAEMPSGAGMPKAPAAQLQPKPPIAASNAPAAAAAKQAQASARGGVSMPHTPGAAMPVNAAAKPKATLAGPPKVPGMTKSENRCHVVTEQEVYTPCSDCGKPEFTKGADGTPQFDPCACFSVMRKDEDGRPMKFVSVLKKNDGKLSLNFSPKADLDAIKAFLLTLKASLLIRKKHGDMS